MNRQFKISTKELESMRATAQANADRFQRPFVLFSGSDGRYRVERFEGYHSGPMELFSPRVKRNPIAYSNLYMIPLRLTRAEAESVSRVGDATLAVDALLKKPGIARQLARVDPEKLRRELKEYGAWSDDELADHEENLRRFVWVTGNDMADNLAVKRNPQRRETGGVRVVQNKLLGGWFVVRGPHQTPIGGRFDSREAALAHIRTSHDAQRMKRNPRGRSVKGDMGGKFKVRRKRIGDVTRYVVRRGSGEVYTAVEARDPRRARRVLTMELASIGRAAKMNPSSQRLHSLEAQERNPAIALRGTRGPVDDVLRARYRKLSRSTKKLFRKGAAGPDNSAFFVQVKRGAAWITLARFASKEAATQYGKMLAASYPRKPFRVFWK